MKMDEMVKSIKDAGENEFYSTHITHLKFDIEDCVREGSMDPVTVQETPISWNTIIINCEDGDLHVRGDHYTLIFRKVGNWFE